MSDFTIDLSKLHKWSIGIVVHDIKIGEDIIEIYPIEKIPDENVNLWMKNEFKEKIINTYPKDLEKADSEEVIILKKDIAIRAMWLSENQYNRITPPSVRKEEYVQIYRYSNADMFFWDTLKNDVRLRKEEVVIHAYSDKPDIDMNETLDNMVYHKIDTVNKLSHLHFPDKHGGLTTFDITVDYGNGYLELIDGKDNLIKLDFDNDKLTLTTNKDIENTTENMVINLKTLKINSESDELIQTLIDLVNFNIADIGVGNLGLPVPRDSATKDNYQSIVDRLTTFSS
jgi:hypothetical protein